MKGSFKRVLRLLKRVRDEYEAGVELILIRAIRLVL